MKPDRILRQLRLIFTLIVTGVAATLIGGLAALPAHAATNPMPAHVFAPYQEAYSGDSPSQVASESGNKYIVMAFLQTATAGSCTAYWNGDASTPISSSTFGSSIAAIQAAGGQVIPSFGGYTADTTGTDIADSCTSVASIAAVYESVITTYNVARIDLDVEANSETNTAGLTRRAQAVAMTEAWAAANGRSVSFSYTIPTDATGPDASGLSVMQNAIANGATVAVWNIMTFDYYIGTTQEMATDTETAANGLFSDLQGLYPNDSSTQLWGMIGLTDMIGIDDYGAAETFTEADASTVLNFAKSKRVGELSFWALERDNGGCPGTAGSDSCSGISQSTWFFSNAFEPFTSGTSTTGNTVTVTGPGNQTGTVGTAASLQVKAADSASGQTLAYSATGLPAGLSISSSGLISGTPTTAETSNVTVTATDTTGASRSASFTWTISSTTSSSGSLVNGGFETGSLSPWTCQSGDAVVTSPVQSGSYAAKLVPSNSQTGECDQTVALSPNTTYTLSGWTEGSYAYIGVSGGATASTWTSSSGWAQQTVSFTTGSSGTVTVYVHGWYAQGNVYADGFSLS